MIIIFYNIKYLVKIFFNYFITRNIAHFLELKWLEKLWGDEILADMPSRLEGGDNGIKTV